MKIIIDNITWNFDYIDSPELLGEGIVGIPSNILKEFIEECGWEDNDIKIVPYYEEEHMEDIDLESSHDCYNPDTQIVLMNYLEYNTERKYNLPYKGEDPFWLFHDNRHSKNDVYGFYINEINSYTEYTRLLEGAEMAKKYGFNILPKTIVNCSKQWDSRFRNEKNKQKFNKYEFLEFIDKERKEEFEFLIEL